MQDNNVIYASERFYPGVRLRPALAALDDYKPFYLGLKGTVREYMRLKKRMISNPCESTMVDLQNVHETLVDMVST